MLMLIVRLIANVVHEVAVRARDGLSLTTNVVDENVVTIDRAGIGLRCGRNTMFRSRS